MSWTAKNSAAAEIDRREEPYLTQAMRDTLTRDLLPRYETMMACTLPALHMVQHAYGWVPPQAMTEIAQFLKLKPAEVPDTASCYEEYAPTPQGEHRVARWRPAALWRARGAAGVAGAWAGGEGDARAAQGRQGSAVGRSGAGAFGGHEQVTRAVKDALGIDVGETTDDGAFTLIELGCLGSCGTAPAMLVDETLHENVRPERVARILDDARGDWTEPPAPAGGHPSPG